MPDGGTRALIGDQLKSQELLWERFFGVHGACTTHAPIVSAITVVGFVAGPLGQRVQERLGDDGSVPSTAECCLVRFVWQYAHLRSHWLTHPGGSKL